MKANPHYRHAQATKLLGSFKISPEHMSHIDPPPGQYPERLTKPVPVKLSDKRRIKAFRVPLSYVADQIVGYQGKADTFKICRMAPDLVPEGFKIVGCWFEHPRNDFYFQIEHPSFPEVASGEKLEAVEILIEEVEVGKVTMSGPVTMIEGEANPDLRISGVELGMERIDFQIPEPEPIPLWKQSSKIKGPLSWVRAKDDESQK